MKKKIRTFTSRATTLTHSIISQTTARVCVLTFVRTYYLLCICECTLREKTKNKGDELCSLSCINVYKCIYNSTYPGSRHATTILRRSSVARTPTVSGVLTVFSDLSTWRIKSAAAVCHTRTESTCKTVKNPWHTYVRTYSRCMMYRTLNGRSVTRDPWLLFYWSNIILISRHLFFPLLLPCVRYWSNFETCAESRGHVYVLDARIVSKGVLRGRVSGGLGNKTVKIFALCSCVAILYERARRKSVDENFRKHFRSVLMTRVP